MLIRLLFFLFFFSLSLTLFAEEPGRPPHRRPNSLQPSTESGAGNETPTSNRPTASSSANRCASTLASTGGTYPLDPSWHMIPALNKDGFTTILQQLKHLKHTPSFLLIGASQAESVPVMPDSEHGGFTQNIGYWIKHHGQIESQYGGDAAFDDVLAAARTMGIPVVLDMPMAHFGYVLDDLKYHINQGSAPGISVDEENQVIRVNDKTFPLPQDSNVYFGGHWQSLAALKERGVLREERDVELNDWASLENAQSEEDIFHILDHIMSRRRLQGLNGINHSHPDAQAHFIEIFKSYIDRGVSGFRLDAALYVDRFALTNIINAVNDYAKEKGKPAPIWIAELLICKQFPLTVVAKDILSRVKDSEKVYFFEFPQMFHFEEMKVSDSYALYYYLGYLAYRKKMGFPVEHSIPTPVNHDFGKSWGYREGDETHNALMLANELASYAEIEFTSSHPSLVLQGTERPIAHGPGAASSHGTTRPEVSSIHPEAPVGNLIYHFSVALKEYRKNTHGLQSPEVLINNRWSSLDEVSELIQRKDGDTQAQETLLQLTKRMALKIRTDQKELLLFINLNTDQNETFQWRAETLEASSLAREGGSMPQEGEVAPRLSWSQKYIFGKTNITVRPEQNNLSVELGPLSISLIEMTAPE